MDGSSQVTVRSGSPSQFSYSESRHGRPQLSKIGVPTVNVARSLAAAKDREEYMRRKEIIDVYTPDFTNDRFSENPWERRGTTGSGIGQNTVPLDPKGRSIMRQMMQNANSLVGVVPRKRLTRGFVTGTEDYSSTITEIEQSLLDNPKSYLSKTSGNFLANQFDHPSDYNEWLVDNFPGLYPGDSPSCPPTEYLQEKGDDIQRQIVADGRRHISTRNPDYRY